ncbi:hypothetical protein PMAYCL1PPCAC_18991, partial [Pristionchus mayeri]
SSSRRTKQTNVSKVKKEERFESPTSDHSTPTYVVEEDSHGALVNKRLGVKWPTRVLGLKKYPHYSSDSSYTKSKKVTRTPSSSSKKVVSIDAEGAVSSRREKRAADGRKSRVKRSRS